MLATLRSGEHPHRLDRDVVEGRPDRPGRPAGVLQGRDGRVPTGCPARRRRGDLHRPAARAVPGQRAAVAGARTVRPGWRRLPRVVRALALVRSARAGHQPGRGHRRAHRPTRRRRSDGGRTGRPRRATGPGSRWSGPPTSRRSNWPRNASSSASTPTTGGPWSARPPAVRRGGARSMPGDPISAADGPDGRDRRGLWCPPA